MATRASSRAAAQAQPDTVPQPPQTPPPVNGGGGDYSPFVWKQLADIQQGMGRLEASLSQIQRAQEKVDEKMDKLEDRLSGVTHKIYAATVVLAILVGIGAFIVDKAWDLMSASIAIQTAPGKTQAPSEPAQKSQ